MLINKKISSAAFKCRGLLWAFFAAAALAFPSRFGAGRFVFGLLIVLAGQSLRFWAAGYIPKYRTETIGAPELVTWGPYEWVRNPLYAGNFIMGLGWTIMVGWQWVAVFAAAFILLYCLTIIPAEEDFLAEKFGDEYRLYKEKVPSLLPFPRKGRPERSSGQRPFDMKRAWAEEIYSIRMNILITVIVSVRLYITI